MNKENSNVFSITVEIPKGSNMKYEIDKKTHRIRLDRILFGTNVYPGDYGYIENTLELDGDPIDVIIITSYPTFPGCVVDARIVGALKMLDNGEIDNKLLAINHYDPAFKNLQSLKDVPEYFKKQIWDFFANYKNVEGKKTEIKGWINQTEALKILQECQVRFKK